MLGTIINVVTIILGSLVGVGLKQGIKENYKNTIMDGLGITIIVIGIMGAIKTQNVMICIGSIVLGALIGEAINIEGKLDSIGSKLETRFSKDNSNFSKGFVSASLIFCVGAMSIVGSIEAGVHGNYETLLAKSALDGITSMILASTLGIGVMFSSVAVLLYQGSFTLLSSLMGNFMSAVMINEMSAVGGILIIGIGINILNLKSIKIGNLLPAVFLPALYYIVLAFV